MKIYFDKQILSNLFKNREEKYIALREKLLSNQSDCVFFYSDAHLMDLQQDQSEIKYAEMEFIQELTEGHRISFDGYRIIHREDNPMEIFNQMSTNNLFENPGTFTLNDEQKTILFNGMDLIVRDLRGELDTHWFINREPIQEIKGDISSNICLEFLNSCIQNTVNDKQRYKQIRDNIKAIYNLSVRTNNGDISFNKKLKDTDLGLTFHEMIQAVLRQMGISPQNSLMVYTMSYSFLDMLGICEEKRGKVRFRNMLIDAQHSFLASDCDCFVSDDKGLVEKSRALYNLFGIGTKICTLDEFIALFNVMITNNNKNIYQYMGEIQSDYNRNEVIETQDFPDYTLSLLKNSHQYFGYFDTLLEKKDRENRFIILFRNYDGKKSLPKKEVEIVVNRINKTFKELGAKTIPFDNEKEWKEIINEKWTGRIWQSKNALISLKKCKELPSLFMLIDINNKM